MKILVVNAGSSSLKYQLFDMDTGAVLAKGNCERIGIDGAITHKCAGKNDHKANVSLPDHRAAVKEVLALLTDTSVGAVRSVGEIGAVGHRFAHGGASGRGRNCLPRKHRAHQSFARAACDQRL